MLRKTIRLFRAQRASVRSLIYLFWIYDLVSNAVNVFVQLFLYQRFASIELNVIATLFSYTGIAIGFCCVGYIASIWRINIKYGYAISFVALAGALVYLHSVHSVSSAYAAMVVWGIGQGIFWLTVNTFELFETRDPERDFYSSMLNAGSQILALVGPAIATALIWLSMAFHAGTFTFLFAFTPAIYAYGFFFFGSIRNYHPPKIEWDDIRHFFAGRANHAAQLYTTGTGVSQTLGVSIVPLATLYVLGTALHVGIFDTFFAVFSALCVFLMSSYRSPSNRYLLYGITTLGLAGATAWFGFSLTFIALIVYSAAVGILLPIRNISTHVIDLQIMETGRKETDFYATMLLRDFFLWIWRLTGGLLFLFLL